MLETIVLHVNGQDRAVDLAPGATLLHFLRNELGLRGVKAGCKSGRCGACAVLVDGSVRASCRMKAEDAKGAEIVTIEGLGTVDAPHPVQRAFIEEGAVQCGYCTPGLVLSSVALLARNRRPTAEAVRAALAWHVCRCGVHERAVRAVLKASQQPVGSLYQVQTAPALSTPGKPSRALPAPLKEFSCVDSWIRVDDEETITVFTGKIEFGQGIWTAIAGIAAEELDVSIARIRVAPVDTDHSPDEGYTVSSVSLETSGNAVRYAAARARIALCAMAADAWGVAVDRLSVDDGTIREAVSGRSVTYWELAAGRHLDVDVTRTTVPKAATAYELVGRPMLRLDVAAKVTGEHRFVQDLSWPDMLHARVVRPPDQHLHLASVDGSAIAAMPGNPRIVQDGGFLAVVAEAEDVAIGAARALAGACRWQAGRTALETSQSLSESLFTRPSTGMLLRDGKPVREPVPPLVSPPDAALTLNAEYFRPFQRHGSLAPSAAAARFDGETLTVWSHAQSVFPLRAELARVLGAPEESIRVVHVEGAGCFGHNGADDATLDAALIARELPGRHVLVKWTAEQEAAWEPAGTAMGIRLRASLDASGRVIDWNHDVWTHSHWGRSVGAEKASGLIAAWHREASLDRPKCRASWNRHGGGHRNADPLYAFPRRRIVKHFIDNPPIRVGNLRSLGAFANVFAVESFMDELAHAAGADPLEFRLAHLQDERARAVIEAVAGESGWSDRGASKHGGRGRGFAFAQYKNLQSYVAVAVDLSVDRETGRIRLERATVGADAGQIVNPDGLSAQLEGGFLQGASWTLFEEAAFGIDPPPEYKVLAFSDVPEVGVLLLNRPGLPILGCGEAAPLVTGAAIANAVFDAVGVRLRQLPLTPTRVREGLGDRMS
jgi:nicotinate dehydrogenase subunit B